MTPLKKSLRYLTVAALLLGLPLAGVTLKGDNILKYLNFPPKTQYVSHANFNVWVFIVIAILEISAIAAIIHLSRFKPDTVSKLHKDKKTRFPWWGWAGVGVTLGGWFLAWTRLSWFAPFQRHTFTIPWIGYILVVNGILRKRTSGSLICEAPGRFLLLFPVSAIFWWFFEYLNRFVQNWHYIGIEDFDTLSYIFFASISFSTVLPAVLSTYALLSTSPRMKIAPHYRTPITVRHPRLAAAALLFVSAVGLAFVGVFPNILFPLVWTAPLLLITALQILGKEKTIFNPLSRGDFRPIVTAPTAALICGFFWELWNTASLAKWVYSIPYVDRFHLFEMPILGYGGYLPFGLECLLIGKIIFSRLRLQR